MSVAADTIGTPAEGVGLKRVLKTRDLVLFGVTMMFPLAPIAVYLDVTGATGGHMAIAYIVAMVAMMFTALSYGAMAGAFPKAGSTYTFTRNGLNQYLGLLAGWAIMLDYLLFPTLNYIILAYLASTLVGGIDYWAWVIGAIVIVTIFNIVEVRWLARVSAVLVAVCIVVIAWFILAAIGYLNGGSGEGTVFSSSPFYGQGLTLDMLLTGTAIACFSYLGFDAISTLAEETHNPGRSVSIGMVVAVAIVTVLFIAQAYFAQLVHPDFTNLPGGPDAYTQIFREAGGDVLAKVLALAVVIAAIANATDATGGASRLMYGMGRDGVLPKPVFGYLWPRSATPVINVLIIAALSILVATKDISIVIAMINFGALFAFFLVNLAAISHYVIRLRRRTPADLVRYLGAPLVGAVVIIWLWFNLQSMAWLINLRAPDDILLAAPLAWLALGVVYVVWTSRFFRQPLPELKETHL
jgi:putrescine importer